MPRRPIRRRPRRPIRRPLVRRGIRGIPPQDSTRGRPVPPALVAANQMFESGQYEKAAKAYLELAERGIAQNIHRAPNLFFQAARCYVILGSIDLAMELIRKTLDYFAKEERWADLYRGIRRSVDFMKENGYNSEAQVIESWGNERIPPSVLDSLEKTAKQRQLQQKNVTLPTHCPSCGGTLNPKEVEWVDEKSALCDFCGSVVRGG